MLLNIPYNLFIRPNSNGMKNIFSFEISIVGEFGPTHESVLGLGKVLVDNGGLLTS